VGFSGFQATSEHRRRLAGSLKLMTSFFCFKSHTTVVPLLEHEPKMCGTFLFHAQLSTSEPSCVREPVEGL